MKRFLASVLVFLMLFGTVAGAAPAFLTEIYNNYTGSYNITFKLDNVDSVMRVLEEEGVLEEIEKHVDIRGLLSELSVGENIVVKAEISDDLKKVKVQTESEVEVYVPVNDNLNITTKSKSYIWTTIDISDLENPVFKAVQKTPLHNKYEYIDLTAYFPKGQETQAVAWLNTIFDKDFVTGYMAKGAELLDKYASIDLTATECVIKIDDAGFKAIIKELLQYLSVQFGADEEMQRDINDFLAQFEAASMRLLGEEGITVKYGLNNGVPTDVHTMLDVSLDLTQFVGSQSEFSLDMLVECEGVISNIGTTTVEYPILTDENSFDGTIIYKAYEEYEYYGDYEEIEYPVWNVYNYVDYLPVVEEKVYFPLRQILTEAYGDTMTLSYDNGAVTVNCEHFPSYKTLSFAIGSDTVYTDGVAHTIGATSVVVDGVTYVSETFVKEILGWSIFDVHYDLMQKKFMYDFATY